MRTLAPELIERRRAAVPIVRYPSDLPIVERRDDLLAAIRDHQVVVVAGETGSGKSTQLPKLCLELGRGVTGMIGHTQPRRIAARTVAERIAEELGGEVGGTVGYAVRFTDRVGDETLVKVMTDGILLAEIQRDRMLSAYDTIIVDEAHERSLNIDFLLGYLHQLLPKRPDLKVVITSATIDTERFAAHFGRDGVPAPIVAVSGRTYPVEVRYRPFGVEPEDDRDQTAAICDAVDELGREGRGDVLVFLSGEREIHDTADAIRRLQLAGTEVLPLYARLSSVEQHRIFQPHPGRRIVLATNVAETSLTVPGVRYVVDAGTARISRYSRRLKVQRLPIEPVSQASANQRAGRCGRVAPGICIRLYDEEGYVARPEFTEPEILRTNLASVILQMAALGLGDVARFPFVDPPDSRSIKDGIALLEELGALDPAQRDPKKRLTPLGRKLARLPIDPRLGRMVLEADRNHCVREVTIIAAALSIQDVRERPAEARAAAEEAHRRFADPDSDFLGLLRLWDHLREQQKALSSNQFRKLCRAEYLNYLRVREWQDLHRQLRRIAADVGCHANPEPATPDAIHRSLLAGLLSQIGMRDERSRDRGLEYQGARGAKFAIAGGSALAKKGPRWVMAAELVETNRLWARTVARIQPEWAERLGGHLAKRTYSEPRWAADRASSVVDEKVTLYGLPVVASRTVPYGRVDRAHARELFIWHALVDGDWRTHHAFVERNRALIEELAELEAKARRRDLLVDDPAVFAFYDARLGREVVSGGHFDRWWKDVSRQRPDLLDFTREDLLGPDAGTVGPDDFPDEWVQDDLRFPVTYVFEPGSPNDGVTVHVPVVVLNRVTPEGFDWGVPGHREELVTALIRALPKPVRRFLVPAPDTARAVLERFGPSDGPLLEVLERELGRRAGVELPGEPFELDRVPDHLRLTFSVEDDDGRVLGSGKDLLELQRRLRGAAGRAIAAAAPDLEVDDLTDWTIGTLPPTVTSVRGGHTVQGFPALVAEGGRVAVRVLPSELAQRRAMPAGTRRLLLRTLPSPRKAAERVLDNRTRLALAGSPYGTVAELLDDCIDAAVDHLVAAAGGPAWDEVGFRALQAAVRPELADAVADAVRHAAEVLVLDARVEARLADLKSPSFVAALVDIGGQLGRLVHPGFVTAAGVERLPDIARYLRAVDRRIDKLPEDPNRDRRHLAVVEAVQQEWQDALAGVGDGPAREAVAALRWSIEELRVSLFAQTIGAKGQVSETRIRKELNRLLR